MKQALFLGSFLLALALTHVTPRAAQAAVFQGVIQTNGYQLVCGLSNATYVHTFIQSVQFNYQCGYAYGPRYPYTQTYPCYSNCALPALGSNFIYGPVLTNCNLLGATCFAATIP
jgi:hypothetical protein